MVLKFETKSKKQSGSTQSRVLMVMLVAVILASIALLAYVLTTPYEEEDFTAFYILGPDGKAADYPEKLLLGEDGMVIAGVVNQEGEETSYMIEVAIDGEPQTIIDNLVLADGEEWKQEIAITPELPGRDQKVEFSLYKDEVGDSSLHSLHLWIDVGEPDEQGLGSF